MPINGPALAAVGAGTLFVWAGIKGVSVLEVVSDLIRGNPPTQTESYSLVASKTVSKAEEGGTFGGRYDLGAVKSHVETAAYEIGPMFNITRIIGKVAGVFDHPRGLALDLMTTDQAKGDALAAFAISNASRLKITYVIWYRRIWSVARASEGWRSYVGVSPHTDHVHISFRSA